MRDLWVDEPLGARVGLLWHADQSDDRIAICRLQFEGVDRSQSGSSLNDIRLLNVMS